jgi:hypothetical protein
MLMSLHGALEVVVSLSFILLPPAAAVRAKGALTAPVNAERRSVQWG